MQQHYGYAGPVDPGSRTVLDVAIGVLVGLRGCAPHEAFCELAQVVHTSGIGIGRVSEALIALARGASGSSAEHDAAIEVWGSLVTGTRNRPAAAMH